MSDRPCGIMEIENEEELTTSQLIICLLCAVGFLQYFIGTCDTFVICCILTFVFFAIRAILVSIHVSIRFLVRKWEERKRETAILKIKNEKNIRQSEEYFPLLRRNMGRVEYLKQYTGSRRLRRKRMIELKEIRIFLTKVDGFDKHCNRFKRNKELEGLLCTLNKKAAALRKTIKQIHEQENCIHSVKRKLLLCHVEEKEERQSYDGLPPPLKTYDRQTSEDYDTMVNACQLKHKNRRKYR